MKWWELVGNPLITPGGAKCSRSPLRIVSYRMCLTGYKLKFRLMILLAGVLITATCERATAAAP